MSTFSIEIVNSDFVASNSLEASNQEVAQSEALRGALQIGVEEVCKGGAFFGAEIRVRNGDEIVQRMMVAIGASTLQ